MLSVLTVRRTPGRLTVALAFVLLASLLHTWVLAGLAQAASGTAEVQRRLNALGCSAGPVDGVFGARTRAGILRFQSANRLAQTGRLGASTRTRMASARATRCDRRPVVRSGAGRRIVLSQRQNYLWLVTARGTVRAQGPMVDNPGVLRPGTYRAGAKCGRAAKVRDNSDLSGSLRLHNFVRFAPCGVGFHQIPQRRSTGAQIHSDSLLGTDLRRSHGCIRVSRAMSQRIWDFASAGTRVVVVG